MARGFYLLIFFLISASAFSQLDQELLRDIQEVQPIALTKEIISVLSDDYFEGRAIENLNIYRTQQYLENIIRSQNLKAYFDFYKVDFKVNDTLTAQNIVFYYQGNPKSKDAVLITANYDNWGMSIDRDSTYIFKGVNDNLTGVTTVLQFAYFVQKVKVDENFIFAFTAAKKLNRIGMGNLAAEFEKNPDRKIKYAINFEMLGKPLVNNPYKLISLQDTYNTIPLVFNQYLGDDFLEFRLDIETIQDIERRAEHSSVYNILKIPSSTITSFDFDNDENYLTNMDNENSINIDYLHSIINKLTLALYMTTVEHRKIEIF